MSDLAIIARMDEQKFKVIWDRRLRNCFLSVQNGFRHKRLDEERAKQRCVSRERSIAGKIGNKTRWGNRQDEKDSSQLRDFAIAKNRSSSSSSSSLITPIIPLVDQAQNQPGPEAAPDGAVTADRDASPPSRNRRIKSNPVTVDYPEAFTQFWIAYPSRVGKGKALESWRKIKPTQELAAQMLDAIEKQRHSRQWQEGFIPNPATWLNQRRWEDELEPGDAQPEGINAGWARWRKEHPEGSVKGSADLLFEKIMREKAAVKVAEAGQSDGPDSDDLQF